MKEKNILRKGFKVVIIGLFFLMILYLTLLSLFGTSTIGIKEHDAEHTFYLPDNPWLHLLVLSLLIGGVCAARRYRSTHGRWRLWAAVREKAKYAEPAVYLLVIVLGVSLVLSSQLKPRADQADCMEAAARMWEYNFSSFAKGGYMDYWPNQTGLVLFFYILSAIIGRRNYVGIQVMNVFFFAGSVYFLTAIAAWLWGGKDRRKFRLACLLISLLFIPMFFYVTFVYGTVPGLFFALAALYGELLYMEKRKLRFAVASSLSIAAAIWLKQNYLIFLIGMAIFLLYDWIVRRKGKTALFLAMAVSFSLLGGVLSTAWMEKLTGQPQSEGVPTASYLAMGMQQGTAADGWWNAYSAILYERCGFDSEAASRQSVSDIKELAKHFLEDRRGFLSFYARKTASQWNNPTFEGFWIMDMRMSNVGLPPLIRSLISGKLCSGLTVFLNYFQTFILTGTLAYLALCRKRAREEELLLPLIFVGGFVFHTIWEAKCQYTLIYFFLLIPFAVKGYSQLVYVLEGWGDRWKAKRQERLKIGIRDAVPAMLIAAGLLLFITVLGGTPAGKLIALREYDGGVLYRQYLQQKKLAELPENGYYVISPAAAPDSALRKPGESTPGQRAGDKVFCAAVLPRRGEAEETASLYRTQEGIVLRFDQYDEALIVEEAGGRRPAFRGETLGFWQFIPAEDGNWYILWDEDGSALTYEGEGRVSLQPMSREDNQQWKLQALP